VTNSYEKAMYGMHNLVIRIEWLILSQKMNFSNKLLLAQAFLDVCNNVQCDYYSDPMTWGVQEDEKYETLEGKNIDLETFSKLRM